jgi:dimethylargininase
VRPPGSNFAQGLTTAELGAPVYALALEQHERYCRALETCGLVLTRLPPDERHPDSTFVEDPAVVTARGALITRPGAPSRRDEVIDVRDALARFYPSLASVRAPGTLDGGDICQAEGHFFIALSERTDESGAQQLADWLAGIGYTSTLVDIRKVPGLLHLKSGLAYLGDGQMAVVDSLAGLRNLDGYEIVRVPCGEAYAANCVRINDHVLLACGYPVFEKALRDRGLAVLSLEMSEFRKMDGGLSCLSLRF